MLGGLLLERRQQQVLIPRHRGIQQLLLGLCDDLCRVGILEIEDHRRGILGQLGVVVLLRALDGLHLALDHLFVRLLERLRVHIDDGGAVAGPGVPFCPAGRAAGDFREGNGLRRQGRQSVLQTRLRRNDKRAGACLQDLRGVRVKGHELRPPTGGLTDLGAGIIEHLLRTLHVQAAAGAGTFERLLQGAQNRSQALESARVWHAACCQHRSRRLVRPLNKVTSITGQPRQDHTHVCPQTLLHLRRQFAQCLDVGADFPDRLRCGLLRQARQSGHQRVRLVLLGPCHREACQLRHQRDSTIVRQKLHRCLQIVEHEQAIFRRFCFGRDRLVHRGDVPVEEPGQTLLDLVSGPLAEPLPPRLHVLTRCGQDVVPHLHCVAPRASFGNTFHRVEIMREGLEPRAEHGLRAHDLAVGRQASLPKGVLAIGLAQPGRDEFANLADLGHAGHLRRGRVVQKVNVRHRAASQKRDRRQNRHQPPACTPGGRQVGSKLGGPILFVLRGEVQKPHVERDQSSWVFRRVVEQLVPLGAKNCGEPSVALAHLRSPLDPTRPERGAVG
mmetsp:Transcript_124076/g.356273  ORF Transcript_124076/g.356273 Transcript_124076/m.356273 type:complete len:557 (-) Transcript_124076:1630-3300(-)